MMKNFAKPCNMVIRALLILWLMMNGLLVKGAPHIMLMKKVENFHLSKQAVAPTITIESTMGAFTAEVGQSHEQYYNVAGSGFASGQVMRLNVTDATGSFTIASMYEGYGTSLQLVANSDGTIAEMIAVNFQPTKTGGITATIDHSADGADTKTLTVDGNPSTLPVELVSVYAKVVNNMISLEWVTASEKNNLHFDVEVMKNIGSGFEKVGRINSKVGNSKEPTRYKFMYHVGSNASGTLYIRLKQVDTDLDIAYSKVIALNVPPLNVPQIRIKVEPNPIVASSQLIFNAAGEGEVNIVVTNSSGVEVYSKSCYVKEGENTIKLYFGDGLPSGIYILSTKFQGELNRIKLLKKN